MNILHIADSISDADGVSSHILQLMKSIDSGQAKQILLCGKIISHDKFSLNGIQAIQMQEFHHAERSITGFAAAVKKLLKLCKTSKTDIIHSHSHYAANISWYVSKLIGVKTVQTLHGIIPDSGRLGHFKAHKFICVSEPGVKHLNEVQQIPADRIFLIRQGIENNEEPVEQKFQKHIIHVAFASRLEYEKGPDIFIKAASIVKAKRNDIKFSIAGDGSMNDELKNLNDKLGTEIDFCGVVKDISSFFKSADVFVMSGRTKQEGFPMAIAEAALAGCLIITSRFDALEFVFNENEDGMIFDIENHEKLAEKILDAAGNKSVSRRMSESFRSKAIGLFSLKTFAENHLRIYND